MTKFNPIEIHFLFQNNVSYWFNDVFTLLPLPFLLPLSFTTEISSLFTIFNTLVTPLLPSFLSVASSFSSLVLRLPLLPLLFHSSLSSFVSLYFSVFFLFLTFYFFAFSYTNFYLPSLSSHFSILLFISTPPAFVFTSSFLFVFFSLLLFSLSLYLPDTHSLKPLYPSFSFFSCFQSPAYSVHHLFVSYCDYHPLTFPEDLWLNPSLLYVKSE
ncbi:unnamed protein product [Acanthosepion pharaonis]|uniref:Uncharacterized protein n=1 Tax=Acanthosepion pharaonis TaxID=158019 RepID=A0A812EJS3_ACAPH|nr:unnamed protein product [Sepia pharaonis]